MSSTIGSDPLAESGFGNGELQALGKDTFGAQVVTKTLDMMNEGPSPSGDSSYDFQKSVLSAVYTGTGTILDNLG